METTQVTNFRREVLRRIARYTWNDCLPEHIYDILYEVVTDSTPVSAAASTRNGRCSRTVSRWPFGSRWA